MDNEQDDIFSIHYRYIRLLNGDELMAGISASDEVFSASPPSFPEKIKIVNPLKIEFLQHPLTMKFTLSFMDWIPCTDLKITYINSDDIITLTKIEPDILDMYRSAVEQNIKNRDGWKDTPLEDKKKNISDSMTDIINRLSSSPEEFFDSEESREDSLELIEAMNQMKKRTIH